jgi:tRNA A-37 threonylcarbamoyl transferase component Bud32
MSERLGKRQCPGCGVAVPADAPEGLCPQCLLKGAFVTGPYAGPAAPTVEELAPLIPQLEIVGLIGQGGMGAVYKARQPSLDRLVALKVLPPEAGRDPAFAERFAREARALARLGHPNIVAVYDFGQAGELYYFVMEYVDGVNLRQLLRDGQLQPEQALRIVPQICDALQYAHEEGIVHRDIKPENILLDRKGRVKIADFGLAKLMRRDTRNFTLTGSQQVMGTFNYMAPEQMDRPQEVDHRADIYSLGVVFYEMLTGQLPVGRFPMPSEKAGTDAFLDEVVLHALERDPKRRYQHASEVKTDVEAPARRATILAQRTGIEDPEVALRQLRGPANGLMIMGVLGPLGWLVTLVISVLTTYAGDRGAWGNSDFWTQILPYYVGTFGTFFLVNAVIGGFLILGGRKMKRLEAYEFSLISSLMAVLQIGTWTFPISFLVGGWAFWILRKPEVKVAFAAELRRGQRRQTSEEAPLTGERVEEVRLRVRWPALGLRLAALINTVLLIAGLLRFFLPVILSPQDSDAEGPPAPAQQWVINPLALCLLPGTIVVVLIIIGATQMLRLRSYGWAVTAAILSLLPCGPAWVISLPAGVWALAVLSKPEVKAAFGRRERET